MSISTRKGDEGSTDLFFGIRAAKSHPRVHALGAVDELNAALGPLRVCAAQKETQDILPRVQRQLIQLMGELSTPPGMEERYAQKHPERIGEKDVAWLDECVASLEAAGALQFKGWALPGEAGVMAGAWADLARVAARRAERVIVDLDDTPEKVPNRDVLRYLNRLSDVLWLLARWEEKTAVGAS
jgi:cob(I)alamin adenosyltransferase